MHLRPDHQILFFLDKDIRICLDIDAQDLVILAAMAGMTILPFSSIATVDVYGVKRKTG